MRRAGAAALLGLVLVGSTRAEGWFGSAGTDPRAPRSEDLLRWNHAIEKFWIHEGFDWEPGQPAPRPPHDLRSEYIRSSDRLRPGAELPPDLVMVRDSAADLGRALTAILDSGAEEALATRGPILTLDWPNPALWRRVAMARVLVEVAMIEERWDDFLRMNHALFVLGAAVARGREEQERPQRAVDLRVGMEVQLAALHALLRADGDGWIEETAVRTRCNQLVQSWGRIRIPWHVFEDPSKAERGSWFGATSYLPQGTRILHQVAAYREVLLHGLGHATTLPRGQALEGWPGGHAQDPLAPAGRNLGLALEAGGALRVWSVGFDGRDDGGDLEKDIVLYPFPADGRIRRAVPGL